MSVPAPAKSAARAGAVRRTVAVDGSALRNGFGGPAAWCVYEDDGSWVAGGWRQATNDQAELTAVPAWVWFCVLATANHFWVDVLAGIVVALVSLGIIARVSKRRERPTEAVPIANLL